MSAIDSLLAQSETPPIILLQGDHGPKGFSDDNIEVNNFTENFAILNAYYFHDGNYSDLYPSISPVNSFRVVLNQYFDTDYPVLEDRSYFSDVVRPFDFRHVTEQVK
jgi:hypothetical protein